MILIRTEQSDEGTFGILVYGNRPGEWVRTGELPWRDNERSVSCIPAGTYPVFMRISSRFGKCYEVTVPGRSDILLHSGNYCGDSALGFKSDVEGCILLGSKRGKLGGQQVVLSSRIARDKFQKHMTWQPFELEVVKA